MKATGNVRKIDKVGRLVLPKDVLKEMRIKSGDKLKIYISDGDKMVLEEVCYDMKNNIK